MASEHNIPAHQAGARRPPPARRRSETRRVIWCPPNGGTGAETRIFITIGYAEDGLRPVEIFYNEGYRSGSDLETLISDIHCLGRAFSKAPSDWQSIPCSRSRERGILLSIMMQHEDVDVGSFCKSLAREQDLRTGDLRFASIIGVLLVELQQPPQWAEAVLAAQETPETETRLNCKEAQEEKATGENAP